MKHNAFNKSKHKRGKALIAVLCLIAVIAFATLTAVLLLSFEPKLADVRINGFRARQAAEMGIAVGSNSIVKSDYPILQKSGDGGAIYKVYLRSEGDIFKVNLQTVIRNTGQQSGGYNPPIEIPDEILEQ